MAAAVAVASADLAANVAALRTVGLVAGKKNSKYTATNEIMANPKRNNGGWAASFSAGLLAGSVKNACNAMNTDAHDISLFLMNMAAMGRVCETISEASDRGLAGWWL